MTLKKALPLILWSVTWLLALATGAFAQEPKAVIQKKQHHFGKVWQGDTASHVFKLKNAGQAELKIENMEILGPYTTVMLKRRVAPGQTLDITVAQDTDKVVGEVKTGAVLHTNDLAHPTIELKMSGHVRPILAVQPMRALFFSPYKGQSPEKTVTIVNYYDRPIKVLRVEADSTRFQTRLETVKEGRKYRLQVRVNPQATPGRTMESAVLVTDSAKVPKIDIGVNIFVRDEVFHFPDQVDFGKVELAALQQNPDLLNLLKQTVQIKRREGKSGDFQITFEHEIPFLTVKKDPESGSDAYRLNCWLNPAKLQPGKIDTFIKVKTTDPEVPELKIPVAGEIL